MRFVTVEGRAATGGAGGAVRIEAPAGPPASYRAGAFVLGAARSSSSLRTASRPACSRCAELDAAGSRHGPPSSGDSPPKPRCRCVPATVLHRWGQRLNAAFRSDRRRRPIRLVTCLRGRSRYRLRVARRDRLNDHESPGRTRRTSPTRESVRATSATWRSSASASKRLRYPRCTVTHPCAKSVAGDGGGNHAGRSRRCRPSRSGTHMSRFCCVAGRRGSASRSRRGVTAVAGVERCSIGCVPPRARSRSRVPRFPARAHRSPGFRAPARIPEPLDHVEAAPRAIGAV